MSDIITPQILPHPKRGTMEIGTERIMPVWCEIRAAEGATDEKPIITLRGTDGSEDRHGTPLEKKGWDFAPYRKHPIALWSHGEVEHWPYVGVTQELRDGGGDAWDFKIELLINQWRHFDVNMPAFLWETYRDFNVAALSVSFIPKEWEDYKAKDIPSFFAEGVRYLRQELTEISFVNVPSNRNAVARTFDKWRSAGRANDRLASMLGYPVSPIILRSADPTRGTMNKIEQFRSTLAETIKRCCGCEPYREPKPESLTEEEKAAEVARLTDLAKAYLATLEIGLAGWRANVHRTDINIYSNVVVDSMYRIEGILYRAKEWYGAEPAIDVPNVDADELQRAITSTGKPVVISADRAARRSRFSKDRRSAARERIATILRCCGCFYEEEPPALPTDDAKRGEEVALLRELADVAMLDLETGMRIWTTAATERLREAGRGLILDSLYRFDTATKWLAEWYGEELDAMPDVDLDEVERAMRGVFAVGSGVGDIVIVPNDTRADQLQYISDLLSQASRNGKPVVMTQDVRYITRAGAVFSKKNLDKIDQIITIATELRAAANKPTPEDVPDEERKRKARAAQFMARMAGPVEFASTQVNLEGDVAEQILALGASLIQEEALAENGRETDVHATVKFGIDPSITPEQVAAVVQAIKPWVSGSMTLGVTAIIETDEGSHGNGADVVYVTVDSVDLEILNAAISEAFPVTDTHPEYIPRITLAYVKKGDGQKFAGDETLAGTEVTFTSIWYSDTEGNLTEIPLAGEAAVEPVGERNLKIRIKDTGGVTREPVTASQPIRVLAPDASLDRGGEGPKPDKRSLYVKVLAG